MKVKKCTGLFLAFLLLISNIGFAIDVHYCGGQIASVSLNATASAFVEKKCCGVSEKKTSCCRDKVVHVDKKSDDATFKVFFFQLALAVLIEESKRVSFLLVPNFKCNPVNSYYSDANAPPLFKLYHQYIFYS